MQVDLPRQGAVEMMIIVGASDQHYHHYDDEGDYPETMIIESRSDQ